MNYHILIVHFPIALLSLYGVLELIRFSFLTKRSFWFPIKAILVCIGAVSSFIAAFSGEAIERLYRNTANVQVIEMHATFATGVEIIFAIISLIYIAESIRLAGIRFKYSDRLAKISKQLSRPVVLIILAIIGLVLITFTGALGGIIAHSPDTDPVTRLVYSLLFTK